ncbi:hypothetical protein GGR55DRAFT_638617 [Xylaria sp. FL0064]|nr:hypothetical protein GGR55DRAFT_638617 [Xylaria sp. FL0064]
MTMSWTALMIIGWSPLLCCRKRNLALLILMDMVYIRPNHISALCVGYPAYARTTKVSHFSIALRYGDCLSVKG